MARDACCVLRAACHVVSRSVCVCFQRELRCENSSATYPDDLLNVSSSRLLHQHRVQQTSKVNVLLHVCVDVLRRLCSQSSIQAIQSDMHSHTETQA